LNRLVSEAVEMAQLDTQEVHMAFAPMSVQEMVDRAMEASSSLLEGRSVTVTLPQLPPVVADAEFIAKVLSNLLENASKYSPLGSPIFVSAERRGEMVEVSVADRGMGVDLSEQGLIFERFYRAQGQRTSGTGMGLAISRAIIEAHRGVLSVTSQLGEGSVFSFTLPVA
jgi:two-component system sensor histidine kinase KdpD